MCIFTHWRAIIFTAVILAAGSILLNYSNVQPPPGVK